MAFGRILNTLSQQQSYTDNKDVLALQAECDTDKSRYGDTTLYCSGLTVV